MLSLRQHSLSVAIDKVVYQQLLSTALSIRALALTLSSVLPHACDWLNGIMSDTSGAHLQDKEFHSSICYWLGVPLHGSPCSCAEWHNAADPCGDHQVGRQW